MKDHRNFFTWRSTTKKDSTWKTKEISVQINYEDIHNI
jgi:hypothetical protein